MVRRVKRICGSESSGQRGQKCRHSRFKCRILLIFDCTFTNEGENKVDNIRGGNHQQTTTPTDEDEAEATPPPQWTKKGSLSAHSKPETMNSTTTKERLNTSSKCADRISNMQPFIRRDVKG